LLLFFLKEFERVISNSLSLLKCFLYLGSLEYNVVDILDNEFLAFLLDCFLDKKEINK